MQVIKVGNAALPIFKVKYNDGTVVEFDTEEELRAVLDVRDLPEFKDMVSRVKVAFQYLKDRMEGNCSNCYDCSGVVETCRVARIFNPTFAAAKLCAPFVDELCAAIPSLRDQADALKAEASCMSTAKPLLRRRPLMRVTFMSSQRQCSLFGAQTRRSSLHGLVPPKLCSRSRQTALPQSGCLLC